MAQRGFDWGPAQETPAAAQLRHWPPALDALAPVWREEVASFLASPVGQALSARLQAALAGGAVVYPPEPFRALALTALDDVRVLILGQDPYHGPGQAQGLAFSVAPGVTWPPSLRNIFKELQRSLGLPMPADGSLERWARQGVLLLNTCLTVEDGQAASHARWGWDALTDRLVAKVAARAEPVVFMLWGGHAQAKRRLIEQAAPDGRHLVLQANHPSPLSALRPPQPFLGCDHFVLAQRFWQARGQKGLAW
ncbi:MAG: uracil-DNA glycosylase [Betaproteobacteria bacterium]|nr:uracil-DNA glycosylase [Betaproteobacteria bacterium]